MIGEPSSLFAAVSLLSALGLCPLPLPEFEQRRSGEGAEAHAREDAAAKEGEQQRRRATPRKQRGRDVGKPAGGRPTHTHPRTGSTAQRSAESATRRRTHS